MNSTRSIFAGTREARIYRINFNVVSSCSAHDTVHIFKLREGVQDLDSGYEAFIEKKKRSVSSSLRKRSMRLTKSLMHAVGDTLLTRSRRCGSRRETSPSSDCQRAGHGASLHCQERWPTVISSEGYFYLYNIDLENEGECLLLKQYSLLDSGDESSVASLLDGKPAGN